MDQEMLQAESLAWAEWPDMSWSWGRISEAAKIITAVPVPELYSFDESFHISVLSYLDTDIWSRDQKVKSLPFLFLNEKTFRIEKQDNPRNADAWEHQH